MEGNRGKTGNATSDFTDFSFTFTTKRKLEAPVTKKGKSAVGKDQSKIVDFLVKKQKPALGNSPAFTPTPTGLVAGIQYRQTFPGPAGIKPIEGDSESLKIVDSLREQCGNLVAPGNGATPGQAVRIESRKRLQRLAHAAAALPSPVTQDCWAQLSKYLRLDFNDKAAPINQVNIKMINDNNGFFKSGQRVIPFLVAVITEGLVSSGTVSGTIIKVADLTGSIHLALHRDVFREFADILIVGSVIIVRNVRQQMYNNIKNLTVIKRNLVFVTTNAVMETDLIDSPLSSDDHFPFLRHVSESVVVAQFLPWDVDVVVAEILQLLDEIEERKASKKGKPKNEVAKGQSVVKRKPVESKTPETVVIGAPPKQAEQFPTAEADSVLDEWGDDSDYLGVLDGMD